MKKIILAALLFSGTVFGHAMDEVVNGLDGIDHHVQYLDAITYQIGFAGSVSTPGAECQVSYTVDSHGLNVPTILHATIRNLALNGHFENTYNFKNEGGGFIYLPQGELEYPGVNQSGKLTFINDGDVPVTFDILCKEWDH